MSLDSARGRWLARVNHDLVKRLLWPARDRRDLGGVALPGELVARLFDDEGAEIGASALWSKLCEEAPVTLRAGTLHAALAGFGAAVARAEAAARAGDLPGVLGLAEAYADLADEVKADADNQPEE